MIRRATLLAVAATLLTACHTTRQASHTTRIPVREALHDWSKAFLVGDPDIIAAFYEPTREVLAIHSNGATCRGIEEIRSAYTTAFGACVFENVSFDVSRHGESGDLAWATGRFRARFRDKSDHTAWDLEVRMSFVMQASGSTWRIVLEQSSPVAGVPPRRPADRGASR